MKRTLLLHVFIFLVVASVRGQYYTNQNKNWVFGYHGGLSFTSGSPVPFATGSISQLEGCASVSNSSGSLLFYTDGKNVWNNTYSVMPSGTSIVSFTTYSTTQATLIVPVIDHANQYYVFSVEQNGGAGHLAYSIVDMTLDGGLGDLVSGSIGISLATSGMSEKITAIAGNNCDIWVITHKKDSAVFWAYDITAAGISAPVASYTGSFSGTNCYVLGVVKATPNRLHIVTQAYAIGTGHGTELYDFNPTSGIVSNCQVLNNTSSQYGAEFSPDNSKLYALDWNGLTGSIYQYDIALSTTTTIVASKTTVATAQSDLKLAADNKIYFVNISNQSYLDCISSPNDSGASCGYVSDAVALASGSHAEYDLPNVFISVAPNDTSYAVQDTSVCIPAGGSITITAHDTLIGSGYLWNDGVTTSRSRSISAYGIYWVGIYNGCGLTVDTIHVMPLLADSAIGATTLCSGATSILSPAVTGGTWSSSGTSVATVGSSTGIITGVTPGTAAIVYNLSSYCPVTVTITVNRTPTAIAGVMSICGETTTALSDGTSGGTWSSSNTVIATVGAAGIVTGLSPGTATITYALADGCFPATAIVNVNPLAPAIGGTMQVCTGLTMALSDATSGGTWSSANTFVATIGLSTGVVSGLAAGTTTISYILPTGCATATIVTVNPTPASITGTSIVCSGATAILYDGTTGIWSSSNTAIATIGSNSGTVSGVAGGTVSITYALPTGCNTVFALDVAPQPSPITGPANTCVGTTGTLIDTTTGGYWTSSNTAVATIDPFLGTVTAGLAIGTSIISYTLGSGCEASVVVTVGLGPLPITGTLTLCPGASTILSDGIGGGSWSSTGTSIATVDASGNVYGVSAGTVIISYTIGSCAVSAIVTVNPLPSVITGVSELCVGLATLLSDASTGGTWSSSNSAIASIVPASGILTAGSAGTTTISYTLPDGCAATTTETVNTSPAAITGATHVCPGMLTALSDAGGGSWSSSNTAIATVGSTGVVGGVTPGTASIAYSIGAGCAISTTVTVNPLPAVISGAAILCVGSTTILSDGTGTWSSSNTSVATIGSASGVAGGVAGGTATVTYTSTLTGCFAIRAVTINPLPLAITGTLTVCTGATTSLNDLTTGGNWSSSTPAIATISSTGMVAGLAPGTSVITYTNPATGCSRTAVVTVNPLPAVPSAAGTLSICGNATTTLTDATTGGLWSSTGSIATVATTSGVVRGVSAGTTVISYTLATGCARSAVVTINPLPAAIIGPSAECVGATIMEDESLSGGFWTSSVTTVATVGTAGGVTGVATGTTVITYTSSAGCRATTMITVSLSPTAIIGAPTVCAHDTTILSDAIAGGVWSSSNSAAATVGSLNAIVTGVAAGTTIITYSLGTGCTVTRIMTVNAAPDGITGTASLCIGATTTLADASTGGTWSSSAAGIATVTGTGIVTGGAHGIDTIIYTQGGCAVTTSVTVNLTPLAITGTGSVCAGDSIALSDAISGGVWTSSNTGIATVDTGGYVTGISPGTATITYSLGAGCAVTKMITVNPVSPISGSMGMCLGITTTLSDATTGGTWSRGTSTVVTVSTTGVVSSLLAGTSAITYTTAAGCAATAVVTVNLAPSAISGTLQVCAGATTALSNTAGGGIWTSGNTAVAVVSAGTVAGIATGTAVITYSLGSTGSLSSGCTVTAVVTVNAVPLPISGTVVICAGTTTELSDGSTGGVWSPATGGIATVTGTGIVSGISSGIVAVSYGFATGCAAITMVTVNPIPAMIIGTTHICAGLTAALSSATTAGSWGSSNTAIATTDPALGIVTGLSPGTSVITYNLPSGCSTSITVTINAAPTAITGSLAVCIGSGTTLGDSSGSGIWSSSNTVVATVSPTGIVSGVALGTSMISYTAGGCPATAVVTINSLPDAIGSTRLCLGATETLTDLPDGGTWSSSDAAVATMSAGGAVTGVSAGTATIVYSLGAGCTVMATITVEALPGAITGVPQVCLGYVTTLIDAAGGGAWSSSNTAIATVSGTGAVSGISGGPVTISYTNRSTGCAAMRLVTVVAVPAITGVSDMCAFSTVVDVSDSLAGGTWTSTSVTVSTAGVVTPYSAGAASLTYTIPLGCYTTTSFTVHPLPGPVTGDFHFCMGLSAALGDTTSGGVWHSSNAAIASINAAGVVRGLAGGTAMISYVLPTGCMETEIITVDSIPAAGTITGSPVVCVAAAITLSDPSAGGVWSSSNTSADVSGGIVSGISAGVDTIRYEVSNSCGSTTATKTIVVNPLPEAGAITGPAIVCVEDSIVLADAVPGGTWSSGASATATITGSILRGLTTGTDTIRYSVTNSCGTAVAVRIVTVNTLPNPGSISLIDTICTGFTYLLTDSIPGGAWSASNSSISVSAAGLISALSAGVDTITYSLTNMCGTASASAAIAVKAMSAPDTITGLPFVCEGGTDTLTVTPQGGVWGSSNGNVTITAIASGASIFGVVPGADTITYTMPGECSAAGGIYPITVLSVSQCDSNTGASTQPSPKEREVLRVWPNPNDGMFMVLLSSAADARVKILITNVIGEKVREVSAVTNRTTEIELNEAEGVYFITVSSSGGNYEAKVVVTR